MTLVVETGSGLRASNSYVSVAFITAYLTELGRETENGWSTSTTPQQEAAAIAGTSYIDNRWGQRLRGTRATFFSGVNARALVNFTGIPIAAETITIGTQVYVWRAALTTLSSDELVIGADAATCASTLIDAISKTSAASGVTHSDFLQVNDSAIAALEEGSTTSIILSARFTGISGNDIPLAETSTNFDITTAFVNGLDGSDQALEFPRANLFDDNGNLITGIPLRLKQASAEYSVRARAAALFVDPAVDDTGRAVTGKFEKVGPIEERTDYEEGSGVSNLLRPYTAADQLLLDYLKVAGAVIR